MAKINTSKALDTANSLIGKKFNKLLVRKVTNQRLDRHIIIECLCDCGKIFETRLTLVINGRSKSCGCGIPRAENSRIGVKTRIKDGTVYLPCISTARAVWGSYKKDGLLFEEFLRLSKLPCYYCNRLPFRTTNRFNVASNRKRQFQLLRIEMGDFTYNGLDRIDNLGKHTIDNVVPCCTDCNLAKRSHTKEYFLDLVKLIHDHHFKNK